MTDFVKYQPKTWVSREFIKKNDMNHLETGVENNSEAIESLFNSKIDGWFIENNVLYFTANGEIVGNGGVKIVQNALTFYEPIDAQETDLIKYLQGTLTDLNNSTATVIGQSAFQGQDNLHSVKLTNINGVDIERGAFADNMSLSTVEVSAKSIGEYAFSSDWHLTTIDLTYAGTVDINSTAFWGNSALNALIIRSNSIASVLGYDEIEQAFLLNNTPITRGAGGIYVPTSLVQDYKLHEFWSRHSSQIFSIEDYPKEDKFETINDSWEDIKLHIDLGDYSTRYKIGDTKILEFTSGNAVCMEIVAFNTDIMPNGDTAKITWLSASIPDGFILNFSGENWSDSNIREWLNSEILLDIPEAVRDNIVEVNKISYTGENGMTTADSLWIPSVTEAFDSGNERDEIIANGLDEGEENYPRIFRSNFAREKFDANGELMSWWLRSNSDLDNFYYITEDGYIDTSSGEEFGIIFGFCMN